MLVIPLGVTLVGLRVIRGADLRGSNESQADQRCDESSHSPDLLLVGDSELDATGEAVLVPDPVTCLQLQIILGMRLYDPS
jgi:hypothetical protein